VYASIPPSVLDYSRFDGIGDSSDEESVREPLSYPAQEGAPSNVLDDLEDYFRRLDERRRESQSVEAPPSVERFTAEEIRTFPTVAYSTGGYGECSVCLTDFAEGEKLTKLPCAAGHLLHVACADACLSRSVHCPLCRVDLRAIFAPSSQPSEQPERPVTPRQLGYTRDGGVILRYEPSPDPSIPRPSYVPLHLHDVASFVEIEYPDSGVARVWRVPRGDEE
jgi:hypothetical protein